MEEKIQGRSANFQGRSASLSAQCKTLCPNSLRKLTYFSLLSALDLLKGDNESLEVLDVIYRQMEV